VSGPVGSPYPGNVVMSVFACFFLVLSAKSALSAYRQRHRERHGETRPQSWEADIGFSVLAFFASVFAFYAIWVHQ
jgi:hypothetical protein